MVPPGNLKDWTIDPFKPLVKKNYLIGRGANDMKSSIACFVAAVSRFLYKNQKFSGSISFLITGDEEGYAINGTKKVIEYLKKRKGKSLLGMNKKYFLARFGSGKWNFSGANPLNSG